MKALAVVAGLWSFSRSCSLLLLYPCLFGAVSRLFENMKEQSSSDWGNSLDVKPEDQVLTKDSVTIMVDAVLYYRIVDPLSSVFKLDDVTLATQMLAQTTLRNILGIKNLSEILVEREQMADQMELNLRDTTKEWGVKVEGVELKDVKLPEALQRAMAAEAEAAREAKAKVTAAEGEMKASQSLKEAALVLSETPTALQLRYLQTLNTISAEKNSTIIFPIPIDFLSTLIRK